MNRADFVAFIRQHKWAVEASVAPTGAPQAAVIGVADEPKGPDLARLKQLYFAAFPDGREREKLPDCSYFRVRPTWVRYSDFRGSEARVIERAAADL